MLLAFLGEPIDRFVENGAELHRMNADAIEYVSAF